MGFISIGHEKLHYLRMGKGPRVLMAFHGYGNDASIFKPFAKHLEKDFTILSFDLPHHGNSTWTSNVPLTQKDLIRLVEAVEKEFSVDKVSLLGYSLGGRVCLNIVTLMPLHVDKVLLTATDGLFILPSYYILTRTWVGRKFFNFTLQRTERCLPVVDWFRNRKLLSAGKHQYIMRYLETEQNRKFLATVWPGMSLLQIRPSVIKAAIRKHRIPITIFMGAFDFVVPAKHATTFVKGLASVKLFVLQKGHRVFDEHNAGDLAKYLL